MTTGTVKTQGTHLWFIETISASDPTATKLVCPTGISGLGGAKDQIETTCLDTTDDKEYVGGLGNPGQVSVPFNLIPRDASHQTLFALKAAGTVVPWVALLSEAATPPTLNSDADGFDVPNDRTSFKFNAYIADVNIDIATNEIVKGTLTLQRSGGVEAFWYEPA